MPADREPPVPARRAYAINVNTTNPTLQDVMAWYDLNGRRINAAFDTVDEFRSRVDIRPLSEYQQGVTQLSRIYVRLPQWYVVVERKPQ